MANFQSQARDGQGMAANGVISAASLDDAGRILRAEGKFIIKLVRAIDAAAPGMLASSTEAVTGSSLSLEQHSRRVRRTDVITFTHQLAVMVETGVPLSEALNSSASQCGNASFQAVLRDVATYVQAGGEFSTALRKYPRAFPPLMTSLIRASEISGTMGLMLERISRYLAKEHQTIKQARGALMYPAFMIVMAMSVTIFLLSFVMPKFARIYASRNAALPAPTRLLLGISNCMSNYWYFWLGGAVVVVTTLYVLGRTRGGRRVIDFIKLHAPVLRTIYTQLYVSRACRTMGTMIAAGVPLLDMIPIVKRVTDNVYYDDLWDAIDDHIQRGAQLSEPLFHTKLVPRSIAQMIYAGEKSGRLGQVMSRVADFAEEEFDQVVKTTTQFIEPVMIGIMGCIIGFVAISLLLPIFTVSKVIAG